MASFKFYFLSALICGVLVLGSPEDPPTMPPTRIIDVDPNTITTTTEATTTEATTPPETTTSTTTTTTPTTTSTTTTTTPVPPTPPAPTPAPKPIGPPDQGLWAYSDNKNVTCIVVQFAAQLNVTYPKQNSVFLVWTPSAPLALRRGPPVAAITAVIANGGAYASEVLHALVNVPANATVVNGNCNGTEQWLTISWPATVDMDNTLTIVFAKNDTTKSYELKNLNTTLVPSIFPNITQGVAVDLYHYHDVEWVTPLASSYRCTPPTELKMVSASADATSVAATLTLSRLQEEAFRTASGNGFSAARDCAGGDIPDAVPIAVGLALGGMVLVVLIAYLVARRRSAARGYLSM